MELVGDEDVETRSHESLASLVVHWEWGYVMLSELEKIGFIKRDLYLDDDAKVKDKIDD